MRKTADTILITYKRIDHIHAEVIKNINIAIYSTEEVQNEYPDIKFNIIKENDSLKFDNFNIEVVKATHGYNTNLKDGRKVFENVGFIIDDGKLRLYITGDTICFNNNYKFT